MRRVIYSLFAVSFLGSIVGCRALDSCCGTSSSGSGSSAACGSKGGCANWGQRASQAIFGGAAKSDCGADGCGACKGGRTTRSQNHGICDCAADDYCTSRAPWLRTSQPAPVPETLPAPMPSGKDNLDTKGKKL